MNPPPEALIHKLLATPLSGADIEARSFAAIEAELPAAGLDAQQWEVVRRLVHTSGDIPLACQVCFSARAISSAVAALRRGCSLYADSQMIRAGLSVPLLQQLHSDYSRASIACHVADADVAAQARQQGLPRSYFALRKAAPKLQGAVVLFGNAPVALLELNRLIMEEGLQPALVVGMPVGFVHVEESKEELMASGSPYIVLQGRRGGSPLAVAVLHALARLALPAAAG